MGEKKLSRKMLEKLKDAEDYLLEKSLEKKKNSPRFSDIGSDIQIDRAMTMAFHDSQPKKKKKPLPF